MQKSLRTAAATAAIIAFPLALTACSSTTDGTASSSTTAAVSTAAEESASDSTTESDATTDSGGSPSSTDGSFTFAMPAGFEDATGQSNVPAAIVEIADFSATGFTTNILVTSAPASGLSLDDATAAVRSYVETSLNTTTSDIPTEGADIDGEPARMFISTPYDVDGVSAASAAVVTIHNDTVYGFILNASADNLGNDVSGLTDFVQTVVWTD